MVGLRGYELPADGVVGIQRGGVGGQRIELVSGAVVVVPRGLELLLVVDGGLQGVDAAAAVLDNHADGAGAAEGQTAHRVDGGLGGHWYWRRHNGELFLPLPLHRVEGLV